MQKDKNNWAIYESFVEIEVLSDGFRIANEASDPKSVVRLSPIDWERLERTKAKLNISANGYAYISGTASPEVTLARWVMAPEGERLPRGIDTDHINGKRLDNSRYNLRLVSARVNFLNEAEAVKFIGKVPGVRFYARKQDWIATLRTDGYYITLGHFATKAEAEACMLEAIGKREDAYYQQIREIYRRKGIPETHRNLICWRDLLPADLPAAA